VAESTNASTNTARGSWKPAESPAVMIPPSTVPATRCIAFCVVAPVYGWRITTAVSVTQ
jgi:hypothetical protein